MSFLISSGSARSCRCYFWGCLWRRLWLLGFFHVKVSVQRTRHCVFGNRKLQKMTETSGSEAASSPMLMSHFLIVKLEEPLVCRHVYDSGFFCTCTSIHHWGKGQTIGKEKKKKVQPGNSCGLCNHWVSGQRPAGSQPLTLAKQSGVWMQMVLRFKDGLNNPI